MSNSNVMMIYRSMHLPPAFHKLTKKAVTILLEFLCRRQIASYSKREIGYVNPKENGNTGMPASYAVPLTGVTQDRQQVNKYCVYQHNLGNETLSCVWK
jgi:hypothetical protein